MRRLTVSLWILLVALFPCSARAQDVEQGIDACAPAGTVEAIFQTENVGQVPELFAGDVRPDCSSADEEDNTLVIPLGLGVPGTATVYVGLVSHFPESAGGLTGWDLSIAFEGDGVALRRVTTFETVSGRDTTPPGLVDASGTIAGGLVAPDDEDPVTGEPQGEGACFSIGLSADGSRSLLSTGTATVLAVTVGTTLIADHDLIGRLTFASRLRGGATCTSSAVIDGESVRITTERSLTIRFTRRGEPLDCCTWPHTLIVQGESVGETAELFSGDVRASCGDESEEGNTLVVPVIPGQTGVTDVHVGLVSNRPEADAGVQGWDLGVSIGGDVEPTEIIRRGTVSDESTRPPGILPPGDHLALHSLADPRAIHPDTLAPQGHGVYAGVVVAFLEPITLAPVGTATLLGIRLEAAGPQGDEDIVGTLAFRPGVVRGASLCRGVLTVGGESYEPCRERTLTVRFTAATEPSFRRGDSDGDGVLDISDGVAALGYLFLDFEAPSCVDSADFDDSGTVVVTDAVALFGFLFFGFSPPLSALPRTCVLDQTEDRLSCERYFACP